MSAADCGSVSAQAARAAERLLRLPTLHASSSTTGCIVHVEQLDDAVCTTKGRCDGRMR